MSTPCAAEADEPFVDPSQLCIGLHVHLDLPWVEHPFAFSSFRIRSLDQIATIQSLGIARLRYSPDKSVAQPLARSSDTDAPPPPGLPAPEAEQGFQAKRERIERLAAQHSRIAACEQQLMSGTRAFRSISQNLFARPDEAKHEALQLIGSMAQSMLVDADIAIHLMAEKIGGEDSYVHALNVTVLAMMLGKELALDPPAIHLIGLGALFHDIGKVDLPDRIVRKTDALTRNEASALQQHCTGGAELARRLVLPSDALNVIVQHHEHVDGSGYPRRLAGKQIARSARIVAIANRYDNLCNPNQIAKALTPHEALSVMYGQQRQHFDAAALTTFVRCMGIYPPGTVVVLSNDAIGIVAAVNSSRPLKPTVLIHDRSVPRDEAVLVDLEHENDVTIARALRPQQLPAEAQAYLAPRKRMSYHFDAQRPS